MTMLTKQQLCDQVSTLDAVDEKLREKWIAHINKAEVIDRDLLEWLSGEMQKNIDTTFDELGVTLDENDPEYRAEYDKLLAEVDAAKNEFEKESDSIHKEIMAVQEETSKQLDQIATQAVQQQIQDTAS